MATEGSGSTQLDEECRSAWFCVKNDERDALSSEEELKYALQCIGRNPTSKKIRRYWERHAAANEMNYEQFKVVVGRERPTSISDLMKAFRRLDTNNDGYITADELSKMLTRRGDRMSQEEVRAIIEQADQNGDGKLDYSEFSQMMLSTAEASRSHCKAKLSTMSPSVNSSTEEGKDVPGHTRVPSVAMGNQDHSVHVDENSQCSISEERPSGSSAIVEVKLSHPVSSGTGGEIPAEEEPSGVRPLVQEEGEQALLDDTRGKRLDSKSVTFDRNTAGASSLSSFSTSNATSTAFRGEDRLREPLSLPKPANEGDVPITITTSETALNEEETSEEPKEETSEQPEEETSEEPKEETSEEPKGETSEEPKGETSEEPKGETSEEPKGETSEEPKEETSEEPQKETSVSVYKSDHTVIHDQIGGFTAEDGVVSVKQVDVDDRVPHTAHSNKHSSHTQHGLSSASEWSLKPLPRPSPLSPLASHSVPSLDKLDRESQGHASTSDSEKPPKASKSGKSKKNRKKTPTSGLSSWDAIHLSAGARGESVNTSLSHSDSSKTKLKGLDSLKRPQHTKENKQSAISSDQTVISSEQTVINSEQTTINSEQTTISSEQTAISSEQTAISSEQTTSSMHSNHSVKHGTVPPNTTKMEDSIINSSLPLDDVHYPPPISIPENLKSWYTISAKGCFYLHPSKDGHEDAVIKSHQYRLNFPQKTNLWIQISRTDTVVVPVDLAVFVFKIDQDGDPSELVCFTRQEVDGRWCCHLQLDEGSYALIPFTTGCWLKRDLNSEGRETDSVDPVRRDGTGLVLSEECKMALKEIYERIDLDCNGAISRAEFDLYQECASEESCDDDTWLVVKEYFEMTSDEELTLKGFYSLHEMTANDSEGGVEELCDVLTAMGYDPTLKLRYACPFALEIFSESCDIELEIIDVLPGSDIVDPALCTLAIEEGVSGGVKGCGSTITSHAYILPHWISIVASNTTNDDVSLQVDCSQSVNNLSNRNSSVHVMSLKENTSEVVCHLMTESSDKKGEPRCLLSLIKQ